MIEDQLELESLGWLRKYKYPPDMQDAAVELVLQQAQALVEAWLYR